MEIRAKFFAHSVHQTAIARLALRTAPLEGRLASRRVCN